MSSVDLPPKTSFPHGFTGYVDLSQLPEFTESDRLVKVKTLGNALFGKVYLMEDKADGTTVALKKMPREKVLRGVRGVECAKNEIAASVALREARGPHNIKVLGAAQDAQHFYLATEYCEHGELFNVLSKLTSIGDESVLKKAIWQILVALRALHRNGVAHRDVSVENVFVASDGTLRLGDYGQAVVVAHPSTTATATSAAGSPTGKMDEEAVFTEHLSRSHMMPGKAYYRPPEMYVGKYAARPYDIFAVGVVLYALRFGNYPFEQAYPCFMYPREQALWRSEEKCTRLRSQLTQLNAPAVSPALADFLEKLMAGNPASRPTADEALAHPWLAGGLPDSLPLHPGAVVPEGSETCAAPTMMMTTEEETVDESIVGNKRRVASEGPEEEPCATNNHGAFFPEMAASEDDDQMSDVSTDAGSDGEQEDPTAVHHATPPTSPWDDLEAESDAVTSP